MKKLHQARGTCISQVLSEVLPLDVADHGDSLLGSDDSHAMGGGNVGVPERSCSFIRDHEVTGAWVLEGEEGVGGAHGRHNDS